MLRVDRKSYVPDFTTHHNSEDKAEHIKQLERALRLLIELGNERANEDHEDIFGTDWDKWDDACDAANKLLEGTE